MKQEAVLNRNTSSVCFNADLFSSRRTVTQADPRLVEAFWSPWKRVLMWRSFTNSAVVFWQSWTETWTSCRQSCMHVRAHTVCICTHYVYTCTRCVYICTHMHDKAKSLHDAFRKAIYSISIYINIFNHHEDKSNWFKNKYHLNPQTSNLKWFEKLQTLVSLQ